MVTLLASILTTVGVTAGAITGLLRNDRAIALIFLMVAVAGVLVGLLSVFVGPAPARDQQPGGDGRPSDTAKTESARWPERRFASTAIAYIVLWLLSRLGRRIVVQAEGKAAEEPVSRRRLTWRGGTRGVLSIVGVLLLFLGAGAVVFRASYALSTVARPSISANVTTLDKPAGWAMLEAHVTATGMTTRQRFLVQAELLTRDQTADGSIVFRSFVGPGGDGKLDYTFKTPFPLQEAHPLIGVTAQLSPEGVDLSGKQACGLPSTVLPRPLPLSSTRPSYSETLSCTLRHRFQLTVQILARWTDSRRPLWTRISLAQPRRPPIVAI